MIWVAPSDKDTDNGTDKRRSKDSVGPGRRYLFGLPRTDNANHLWIQLFHSALNANGVHLDTVVVLQGFADIRQQFTCSDTRVITVSRCTHANGRAGFVMANGPVSGHPCAVKIDARSRKF